MFRLILQTQGRLEGFSVLSHLLSPKVKSTLLSIYDLYSAMNTMQPPEVLESVGPQACCYNPRSAAGCYQSVKHFNVITVNVI